MWKCRNLLTENIFPCHDLCHIKFQLIYIHAQWTMLTLSVCKWLSASVPLHLSFLACSILTFIFPPPPPPPPCSLFPPIVTPWTRFRFTVSNSLCHILLPAFSRLCVHSSTHLHNPHTVPAASALGPLVSVTRLHPTDMIYAGVMYSGMQT